MRVTTRDFVRPKPCPYMKRQPNLKRTRSNTVIEEKPPRPIYNPSELAGILTDPLPNLYEVFKSYNKEYFENKVRGFIVRWSSKLSQNAGLTQTRTFPEIILSRILLTGRKIKDMVETLVHEMIHAYIFVNMYDEGLDHEEIYLDLMAEINARSGLNITVLDEGGLDHIAHLRCIWRCTKCGLELVRMKRNTNQPNDNVSRKHRRECNGRWREFDLQT